MNVGNVLSAIKTLEAVAKYLHENTNLKDTLIIKRVEKEIAKLQNEVDCIQLGSP